MVFGIPWHRLPVFLGIPYLSRFRNRMRRRNLVDTSQVESTGSLPLGTPGDQQRRFRTVDGTFNDLREPRMGSVDSRFGRNVPLQETVPEEEPALLEPSPRTVSLDLMTRHQFQPVPTLNLLAASWIQFQVHDWFSHGKNQKENPIAVPLQDNDAWPERPMKIRRTRRDPTLPPSSTSKVPTYVNTETHWWDGSQIYGSQQEIMTKVRSGEQGKLKLESNGLLPVDPLTGIDISGVTGNWWVGLSMLHTLFTWEHNAICDHLHQEFPAWSDEELFGHARLINAALMAKIHTIEWTPAILDHPTVQFALNGNWRTIPRSHTNHHAAPFSMTEEFVSVYRMHPLMPDDFVFRSLENGEVLESRSLPQILGRQAREIMNRISLRDLFFSFGISHPGAITLHNFPRFLQRFERPDGPTIDLAAIDVLRDRERGVPRYNRFRELIDMPRVESFEKLTDRKEWVEELRRVYNNDIDRVDLMVGLYAEPLPEGFGFSETAFRIFILMASRRLQSDRFFTEDYSSKIYTRQGLKWIEDNSLLTVLRRHLPELKPVLAGLKNGFQPWPEKA